jgi:KDO2-lipid IV(A) lauroyltransferase
MVRRARDELIYHGLRGVLGVGGLLPLALTRPACRLVTRVALRYAARDRARMDTHIRIAFPELDGEERRRLVRGCADHLGCVLAEVAWLWRAGREDVKRLVDVEGIEHLWGALDGGRGAILATGHIGNWELLNARLAVEGIPITLAVRELDDPRVDGLVTDLRSRFGTEIILRGVSAGRQLIRALASGRGIGLLIDQDIPSIPGVFVPFFGRPAWTPSGAAMLALRARCPLLSGFIHRRPDGSHKITIEPSFEVPAAGSLQDRVWELTAAATARVEWQIRAWPEQWVWMHRRWRTTPDDHSDRDS